MTFNHRLRTAFAFTLMGMAGVSAPASAGVLFFDDFEDGDTAGWTFHRTDAGEWGNTGSVLNSSTGSDDQHDGTPPGFALIQGVVTPDQFTLEADVSVTHYPGSNDRGHVGLVWGVSDPDSLGSTFNTTYLRTHSDHVTTWDSLGGNELTYAVGPVANNVTYHLKIDVDFVNQQLISTFTNGALVSSVTYSGSAFDSISHWSGGSIGLIGWGEEVTYDNVKLTVADVPAPATLLLFGLGLIGFGLKRASRVSDRNWA